MTRVEELARTIAEARPRIDTTELRIFIGLYRRLAEGRPVAPDGLARSLELAPNAVTEAIDTWPGTHRDEQGHVIGFWGLSLSHMPHRFEVDGIRLYTWCAWDSLFLPEILSKTAKVESACPVTGETIRLTVTPDRVEAVSPPEAVVSFLCPTKPFDADVVMSFCHYVLFFSSNEAGERWSAEHDGTFLLTVREAYEVGRLANRPWRSEIRYFEKTTAPAV